MPKMKCTRPCRDRDSGQRQQRASLEEEQQIFHREKRNDGARRVEQSSVRYGSIGITKACREDSGMGLTKKRKEKQRERTGVRGQFFPTRRRYRKVEAGWYDSAQRQWWYGILPFDALRFNQRHHLPQEATLRVWEWTGYSRHPIGEGKPFGSPDLTEVQQA